MTRQYALTSLYVVGLLTITLFLSGCIAPNSQVAMPAPQVIMQGDTPGQEEVQPIELDNCNGKGDTKRTEQRTRSIESTISAEIAAKFGASAEVLSAEVQAAVGAAMKWGAERSTSIELVAPPGTRMAFQLVWIGDEQVGIIQNLRASSIPIAFRSFKPTDVRIKSQYDIGCPPSSTQTPTTLPLPATNIPFPTSTAFSMPAPRAIFNSPIKVLQGDFVLADALVSPNENGTWHTLNGGSYGWGNVVVFDDDTTWVKPAVAGAATAIYPGGYEVAKLASSSMFQIGCGLPDGCLNVYLRRVTQGIMISQEIIKRP